MSNAIVKYETDQGIVHLSPELIRKYLVSGGGNVTDQEITMFLNLCKYQKLNPFLREAYLIKFGAEDATIVTGKEVFTKRASKNPICDGWEAGIVCVNDKGELIYRSGTLVLKTEELVGGWCEVRRKDWSKSQRNEVSLSEYIGRKRDGTPNKQWTKMPATMIRKVAIVQALRDAFPEDLQGLYSQEEMPVDASNLDEKPVVIIENEELITTEEAQEVYTIANYKGYGETDVKKVLAEKYGIDSAKKLTKSQYQEIMNNLKSKPDVAK